MQGSHSLGCLQQHLLDEFMETQGTEDRESRHLGCPAQERTPLRLCFLASDWLLFVVLLPLRRSAELV